MGLHPACEAPQCPTQYSPARNGELISPRIQINSRRKADKTARDFTASMGEGTPRKLATATQPQFPGNVADFKKVTDFQD
jgi:hypothetical protein